MRTLNGRRYHLCYRLRLRCSCRLYTEAVCLLSTEVLSEKDAMVGFLKYDLLFSFLLPSLYSPAFRTSRQIASAGKVVRTPQ